MPFSESVCSKFRSALPCAFSAARVHPPPSRPAASFKKEVMTIVSVLSDADDGNAELSVESWNVDESRKESLLCFALRPQG